MPGHAPGFTRGALSPLHPNNARVEFFISPEETNEELKLWADYYEATARVLEIMRAQGVTADALAKIVAEDARAARAIKRIKKLRGITD